MTGFVSIRLTFSLYQFKNERQMPPILTRDWQTSIENWNWQRNIFPKDYFVLNYTSLIEDPNKNMDMLFSFLRLRWDPSYLTNHNFNQKGKLFGRPPSPGFNTTRAQCHDCITNPYGGKSHKKKSNQSKISPYVWEHVLNMFIGSSPLGSCRRLVIYNAISCRAHS